MSGAELARLIGVKGPSMWQIENGVTKSLKAETLSGLCEHLRTTVGFILSGDGEDRGLQLATMEAELMYSIRKLPPEKRIALMEYARFLMGQQPPKADEATPAGKPAVVRHLKTSQKRK